jgi:ion channel-forming bestrophin family protein
MMASLSGLIDTLSNFERIRTSPIPLAYSIHLNQTLFFYLTTLPFQIVTTMHWATIGVMFIASFTLLGIHAIAKEIENPFGYDDNDLDMEGFCAQMQNEIAAVMRQKDELDALQWGEPSEITTAELHTPK